MRGEEMRVERRRAPAVIRQVRGGARGRLRRGSSGRGIPTTAVGCRGSSGRGIPTTAVGYPLQRASVVVHRRGELGSKRGRDVQMCRGDGAFCDIVTRPVAPVANPPWSPRRTTRWGTPVRRGSHRRLAPGGGAVGTQLIAGTCPPLPNGFGPESSQRYLWAVASQRHWGPVTPSGVAPSLPPPSRLGRPCGCWCCCCWGCNVAAAAAAAAAYP